MLSLWSYNIIFTIRWMGIKTDMEAASHIVLQMFKGILH